MNPMREISVEKITLNIGVGKPGAELDKAKKLLEMLSGAKPVETRATKRIPTWGIRPGLAIGTKVTLRGEKAAELLKKLLSSVDYKVDQRKFDKQGNFAFGIREYIDIPGVNYNVDLGILGLEVAVTLQRPGFRIKKRSVKKKGIPARHAISKEEAVAFAKAKLGVKMEEAQE
ncbi:50S ribosomal protein L5 [Candidatus Woesearchaeota archaeon]|nr:50S ribosomal protein L5 [Candidatus Woesearchaeota archaeon]